MTLYLRYRNSSTKNLSEIIDQVFNNLENAELLKKANDSYEITSFISRVQCSRCHYINYLSDKEHRCSRCGSSEMHDFPNKNLKTK